MLLEHFNSHVKCSPTQIALICGDEVLTYAELQAKSNQLAHFLLAEKAIKSNMLVPIMLDRSVHMLITILAVWKIGGAYVPIDPLYPLERVKIILKDCAARLMITKKSIPHLMDAHIECIFLDNEADNIAKYNRADILNNSSPQNLAYVIFTSGSTGKPKGVLIEHHSLINLLHAMDEHLHITSSDVMLASTAFTFDTSILELFLPLFKGARCVIATHVLSADIDALQENIRKHNISIMQATPSLWRLLLEADWAPNANLKILCGGEMLASDLAKKLLGISQHVWNVYGPTETTIWSTLHKLTKDSVQNAISIGEPLRNTCLKILDEHQHDVVEGELYIGGDGVARGYLERDELTQTSFINLDNQRFYRTGDLVRRLKNDEIIYLMRNDDQVKIRGYRIELAEIEACLQRHSAIMQACVLAINHNNQQKLVAYVVIKGEMVLDTKAWLSKYLPQYMLPHHVMFMSTLPLTSHGKLDKSALRQFYIDSQYNATHQSSFISEPELKIAKIWSSVLHCESNAIDKHANFMLLGGDSLSMAQVVVRVRKQWRVAISIADLFTYPTLAEFSAYIESQPKDITQQVISKRQQATINKIGLPQQRLLVLNQFQKNNGLYNIALAVNIVGKLNILALERALIQLIKRHASLRTNFLWENTAFIQKITASVDVAFKLDQQNLSDVAQISSLLKTEIAHPFDLTNDNLFRVKLLCLKEREFILVLTMHHVIADDWSLHILKRELSELYNAECLQTSAELNTLAIDYADYAYWQHADTTKNKLQIQRDYWREQLRDIPTLSLPLSYQRPARTVFVGQCTVATIPATLVKQVKVFAKQEQVTLFTVLFSAFSVLLSRYSGQEDIAIGTAVAGRVTEELEELIGFFVNTLVLRTDLSEQPNFSTIVHRHQTTLLAALANQDLPFDQVVETLNVKNDLSRNPLFQVMFVLQNAPQAEWQLNDLEIQTIPLDSKTSKFDLTLVLSDEKESINGYIEFNTQLFSDNYIQAFWQHFLQLLEACLQQPQQSVIHLPMLTQYEQQTILQEWSGIIKKSVAIETLHAVFEKQVIATPDNIALTFMHEHLTYAQLNRNVNQLARYLRTVCEIRPDTLIPIMIDRGFEMIVAMLAVLKAGGAYVPIDPKAPRERITYLLTDCVASVVLTQSHLQPLLLNLCTHIINVDDNNIWRNCADDNLPHINSSHDLAYVIYTSGSTGKPKGVMIQHSGVLNTIQAQIPFFKITAESKILQFASFSFDSAVSECYRALLSGACLALNPANKLLPGETLAKTLDEQQITVVTLPPAALTLMPVRKYANLQTLITAGEACTAELMNQWADKYHCVNAYGPTEISICATASICQIANNKPVMGKPLANVHVYVLDKNMQPLPVNVPGELFIGGAGLARGYLHQAELTQMCFLPNPFSEDQQTCLYKTGDVVRWLDNGNLDFLGRNDDQVKIRGFRIELGEVEQQLLSFDNVTQAVVLVKDNRHNKRLVAYIVATLADLDLQALRDHMTTNLPNYMLPSSYIVLDEMPMTINRKIDKASLLALPENVYSSAAITTASTHTELALIKIWEKLLHKSVGNHDDFFALGGHSLLVVSLVMEIEKILHTKVSIATILDTPTIAQLAVLLDKHDNHKSIIVKLKDGTGIYPIYFVHETTGSVLPYLALSQEFATEISVYSIQDPFANSPQQFNSLEEMAACYVQALLDMQPQGPYFLGGWCMGGVIAYEMARQLAESGAIVENLLLIDAPMNIHDKSKPLIPATELPRLTAEILSHKDQWFPATQANLTTAAEVMAQEMLHRMQLMRTYEASDYPHPVTLIKASEKINDNDTLTPTHDNGWEPLLSDLRIYHAAGNHQTMLKSPHAHALANLLSAIIGQTKPPLQHLKERHML
jgi:surfactin family lipopeptide synthetase A